MPALSKITSNVKKQIKNPIGTVKNIGKQAISKPNESDTINVMLGMALGAPLSKLYDLGYNATIGKIEMVSTNSLVKSAIKILIPIVPMGIVAATKIPFGNVINGTLLGIIIAEIISAIVGISGINIPFFKKKEVELSVNGEDFALFG